MQPARLPRRKVGFLVYLNRSGSTFLANQLSAHPALCVCLEADRALRRLLGQVGPKLPLDQRISRLLDDVRQDEKLAAWGLTRSKVAEKLEGVRDEIDALYALLDAYADVVRPGADRIIVKGYFFIDLINRYSVEELDRGRDLRLFGLVRDPRAIFNSQRQSISSTSGRVMQESALAAALRWRLFIRQIDRLANADGLIAIRYEDLIERNDSVLCEILHSLGAEKADTGRAELEKLIPEGQRHLHRNIGTGPLKARSAAWRTELPATQRKIIEAVSGEAMAKKGYLPENPTWDFNLICSLVPDAARWIRARMRLIRANNVTVSGAPRNR